MPVKKITISMDNESKQKCDSMAEYRGMSRSQYISWLVQNDVEVRMREIVLSREGFVRVLMDRVNQKRDIGKALAWVDSAMILQNDAGRPVYVLEVEDGVTEGDVAYIRGLMQETGCAACLIPKGTVEYVGTLTPASMRIKDKQLRRNTENKTEKVD